MKNELPQSQETVITFQGGEWGWSDYPPDGINPWDPERSQFSALIESSHTSPSQVPGSHSLPINALALTADTVWGWGLNICCSSADPFHVGFSLIFCNLRSMTADHELVNQEGCEIDHLKSLYELFWYDTKSLSSKLTVIFKLCSCFCHLANTAWTLSGWSTYPLL